MPRDASGNYTLPAGNPVVTATTISSSWANSTMSDIASALTDSISIATVSGTGILSKSGSGADDIVARTITGTANKITVTNGDGVSGNPTLTIPDAVTLVTPTITGSATVGVDLAVTGTTTTNALTATGNASVGGTLGVTGIATMGQINTPANNLVLNNSKLTLSGSILEANTGIVISPTGAVNASIELGSRTGASQTYFDFHTCGTNVNDFDARILATGGSSGVLGAGTIEITALGGLKVNSSEVYRRNNIISGVSQVAGVPTGGVIEYGSNANGSYVRFADGTQICWFDNYNAGLVNIAAGSIYASADKVWTYPAAFASIPAGSGKERSGPGRTWLGLGTSADASMTQMDLCVFSPVSTAVDALYKLFAIGRWY